MRILGRNGKTSQSIRFLGRDEDAVRGHTTAVSLHSHTLHSRESLDFIPRVLGKVRPAQTLLRTLEERHHRTTGKAVPYNRVYWRPPLNPMAAYRLETRQISETLRLKPLVSITDHDNLDACTELRAMNIEVPFSHEWSVPYESTVFHIGVHNLPPDDARRLFEQMERVTAHPGSKCLLQVLQDLNANRDLLVVLNHPLSNDLRTGFRTHARLLQRFLREYRGQMQALELNGLQPASHNRRVAQIAAEAGLPTISGGDRHCVEPNANVNLTNATTFADFVDEIRREHVSRVLFMPQYREAIACRYIEFISEAVRTYPEFTGREGWVDRVFKQTEDGDVPASTFWPRGVPWLIRTFVSAIGLIACPQMRATLRLALRVQTEAEA